MSPFASEKQKRFMFAKHPEIARRWVRKYGAQILKHNRRAKGKKIRG